MCGGSRLEALRIVVRPGRNSGRPAGLGAARCPDTLHAAHRKAGPRALATVDELKAEIAIELDLLQQVVNELEVLRRDVAAREPTVREKTAAAAFLAQFYTGIENILNA